MHKKNVSLQNIPMIFENDQDVLQKSSGWVKNMNGSFITTDLSAGIDKRLEKIQKME